MCSHVHVGLLDELNHLRLVIWPVGNSPVVTDMGGNVIATVVDNCLMTLFFFRIKVGMNTVVSGWKNVWNESLVKYNVSVNAALFLFLAIITYTEHLTILCT